MSGNRMVNVGISYKTVEEGLRQGLMTPTLVYNLVGYSGIGKTAIVRQVVEELGGHVVEINSSLLQAGDLAMPVKHEDELNNPTVQYVVNDIVTGINKKAKADPNSIYVLFLDEFNRADAEVQSDLMNLILQRQLFDVTLEPNVRLVTAQNPDRTTEGFEHTNYDVHEVDEATASRVVDIRMRYSASDWLDYGTTYNEKQERHNVHPMVTSYIANGNEELLLVFNPDKRNTPSPRSWTRVGELLYDFNIEDFEKVDNDILNFLNESITGTVGASTAESFMAFGSTFTSYIKLDEWLEANEEEFEELLERYKKYDSTKKVFMVEDLVSHMVTNEETVKDEELSVKVARVLGQAPMDTITSQLRFLIKKYGELLKGQKLEVDARRDDGETYKETHSASMVYYVKFINSDKELHEKHSRSINNSTVDTNADVSGQ